MIDALDYSRCGQQRRYVMIRPPAIAGYSPSDLSFLAFVRSLWYVWQATLSSAVALTRTHQLVDSPLMAVRDDGTWLNAALGSHHIPMICHVQKRGFPWLRVSSPAFGEQEREGM